MFELPKLPYKEIEGFLSEEQLKYHHGKHHKAYVDKLNKQISEEEYDNIDGDLNELLYVTRKRLPIFNNAAQHWNHSFFWRCITPGGLDSKNIKDIITKEFGSFEGFVEEFKSVATNLFGSGWVWLVAESSENLYIASTSNADNPLLIGQYPLLTLDVWEHAYYVDYKNDRKKYIDQFMKNINWEFVNQRYEDFIQTGL